MAQYWIVRTPGGEVEGPYTVAQLHELVAAGAITAETLVSSGGEWHPAPSVTGLFTSGASTPVAADDSAADPLVAGGAPEAAASAPGAGGPAWTPAAATVPPTLSPPDRSARQGPPGPVRRLNWLIILSALLAAFGLLTIVVSIIEEAGRPGGFEFERMFASDEFLVSDAMGCGQLLCGFGLWVYYLVWVYMAHREVHVNTNGGHSITPGLALGLCFVPVFNIFWGIYMPFRLARTIEEVSIERTGRASVVPNTVLVLLILAVVPSCCIALGVSWVFTSIAMFKVQNGLNALWLQGTASP